MDKDLLNALMTCKQLDNENKDLLSKNIFLESQIVKLKKELDNMNVLKSEKLKSYELWALVKSKELHECPRCKTRAYYSICPECDTARGRHIPCNPIGDTTQIRFKNDIYDSK